MTDLEAGVLEGPSGVLYGVTRIGGPSTNCGVTGCGTVFKLVPRDFGGNSLPWNRYILHSFTGYDGEFPVAALVGAQLSAGTFALFGTGKGDGGLQTSEIVKNYGSVFEIIPQRSRGRRRAHWGGICTTDQNVRAISF